MRLAVERVVGEVVAAGERADLGRTEVVGSTAAVELPVCAEVVVVRRYVSCAAPFCT